MTLVLAKQFAAIDDSQLSHTNVVYDEQGTSWSAVNPSGRVLMCWIATISGNNRLVGRIDGRGYNDDTITNPSQLSTTNGVEGVRVCYNPSNAGWVIAYNVGSTVYIKTLNSSGSTVLSDTALSDTLPAGYTSATYNMGMADNGYIYICWPNRLIKILASTGAVENSIYIEAGLRLHVHQQSGYFDVSRIYNNQLIIDRYDDSVDFRYSVICANSSTLDAKLHGITGRYGDGGFFVAFLDGTSGDNVFYRGFAESGDPLYATQTLSGTGHVDISSNQGRFHLSIGEIVSTIDQWHTYVIRATSTNASSGRIVALIEPKNFYPSIIRKVDFVSVSDSDMRYGGAIVAVSQFELRALKVNTVSTPTMDLEVYVRQGVWMNMWRIENTGRFFVDTFYDNNAYTLASGVYSGYAGGDRTAGSAGTDDANYTGSTGRSGVNPDTTSFTGYWGTATTEDDIFIGGPVLSQIAESFEDNPNCFDAQITTLASEIGFSMLEFYYDGRILGFRRGSLAPEIRVTVGGNTYLLQRHQEDASIFYQQSDPADITVDYGLIIRLPLATSSTQSDRCFIYIAGINAIGTKAAAYVFANPLLYKLGSASAHLVVAEYDDLFDWENFFTPGTTGIIRSFPMELTVTHNFEGDR